MTTGPQVRQVGLSELDAAEVLLWENIKLPRGDLGNFGK